MNDNEWSVEKMESKMAKVTMKELLDAFQKICELPESDEKEDLAQTFFDGMKEANRLCLNMASAEGVVTEEEIRRWMKRYDVTDDELGELLKAHYFRKINKITDEEKVVVVTNSSSPTWRMKALAQRRFNLKVVDE